MTMDSKSTCSSFRKTDNTKKYAFIFKVKLQSQPENAGTVFDRPATLKRMAAEEIATKWKVIEEKFKKMAEDNNLTPEAIGASCLLAAACAWIEQITKIATPRKACNTKPTRATLCAHAHTHARA